MKVDERLRSKNGLVASITKHLMKFVNAPVKRVRTKHGPAWDKRLPKGSNLDFICAYIALHGPSRSSDIRRAMAKRVGVKYTSGQYSDYFYRVNGYHRRFGELYEGGRKLAEFGRGRVHCKNPLWEQLTKRGPWSLTDLGYDRVGEILGLS